MKIRIQPRDEKILKFIFACRVASVQQVLHRYFQGRHRSIGYERLNCLIDAGLIRRHATMVNGNVTAYLIPLPKCWEVIGKRWPFEVDRPHFKSESSEHDIRVAEIMMRLEKLQCFRSFFTENLLQSSSALADDPTFGDLSRIQSDGALTITGQNGEPEVYAFELEISKKSPERYRDKLTSYFLAKGISGVLCVCPEAEVSVSLAKVESEFGSSRNSILWLALEANVLRLDQPLRFVNRRGVKIDLL